MLRRVDLKDWWVTESKNSVPTLLVFVVLVFTGWAGLGEPSPILELSLGFLTVSYSVALIISSLIAGLAVVFKLRRTEFVSFVILILLTFAHSIGIFVNTDHSGDQTGWRIFASAVTLFALATERWMRGLTKWDVEKHFIDVRERENSLLPESSEGD